MHNIEQVKIPRSIWALGFVSLFIKSSTVVLFSVVPLYITNVLGVGQATLGLLEGLVELFSLATRMLSGVISDFISKRKAIIIFGYVIALISRPILALAPNVEMVFLGRSLDRIGNGLDATPRDALVGDLAPKEIKGSCYGLRQSLGTVGAILGSALAIFLLWITGNDYPIVFWIGIIPTGIALLLLLTMVSDPISKKTPTKEKKRKSAHQFFEEFTQLSPSYWMVILMSFVFMTSNYSGAFLTLSASAKDVPIYLIPLTMVIQNIATSAIAYPVGYLSDKFNRRTLLLLGFLVVILANASLAGAMIYNSGFEIFTVGLGVLLVFLGIFLWGAQLGFTQSLLAACVADTCNEKLRGTGFGIFHLLNGCAVLIGNCMVGLLWETVSPEAGFSFSALAATIAFIFLLFIKKSTISSLR